jgi:hypothetical protein
VKGVVVEITPVLVEGRLKVSARIRTNEEGELQAYLPDREVAAFLPRSLLVGRASQAPPGLLDTMRPILSRFAVGRQVRTWDYGEERYCSFPSWRSVRFREEEAGDDSGGSAISA